MELNIDVNSHKHHVTRHSAFVFRGELPVWLAHHCRRKIARVPHNRNTKIGFDVLLCSFFATCIKDPQRRHTTQQAVSRCLTTSAPSYSNSIYRSRAIKKSTRSSTTAIQKPSLKKGPYHYCIYESPRNICSTVIYSQKSLEGTSTH